MLQIPAQLAGYKVSLALIERLAVFRVGKKIGTCAFELVVGVLARVGLTHEEPASDFSPPAKRLRVNSVRRTRQHL